MTSSPSFFGFVATAEAAFIAGLSDRDMNRVVDEHILPDVLVRNENGRWFARMGAALTSLYFGTENILVAEVRRTILGELTMRLLSRPDRDVVFALPSSMPKNLDWHFKVPIGDFDFAIYVDDAWKRVRRIERAEELVRTDPEILSGIPVFAGTRVPIETVTASLENGIDKERLRKSYPFLTDEHFEAARVHSKIHPRRGRPTQLSRPPAHWRVRSRRTVRPEKA